MNCLLFYPAETFGLCVSNEHLTNHSVFLPFPLPSLALLIVMNRTRLYRTIWRQKSCCHCLFIGLHVPVDKVFTVPRPYNACGCMCIRHISNDKRDASAIWIMLDRVTNVKLCIYICKQSRLPCSATRRPGSVCPVSRTNWPLVIPPATLSLKPKHSNHVIHVLTYPHRRFNIHISYRCSSFSPFITDLSLCVSVCVCVKHLEGVLLGFRLFLLRLLFVIVPHVAWTVFFLNTAK